MISILSKISLTVSVVLFFLGFLILCECPGWYVLAAAFAIVPAWKGTSKIRRWGIICLIACLAMAVVHAIVKFKGGI
jgi:hypothetical protein